MESAEHFVCMHHELLTGVILRPLPGGSDDVDDVVVVQSPVRANWFLARGRVHATSYLCVSGSGNVGVEEAKSRVVIMEVSYCPVIGIPARGCGAKVGNPGTSQPSPPLSLSIFSNRG